MKSTLPCVFLVFISWTAKAWACPIRCRCNSTTSAMIVDCTGHNLKAIPGSLPGNTTHLILRDNKISSLERLNCSSLPDLVMLDVSWNNICSLTSGQLLQCSEIVHLDLSYNKIKSIDALTFWGLVRAEIVDLSGNRIDNMESGSFYDLVSIKELRLHDNKINTTGSALSNRNTLEILDLSKNKIENLDEDMFKDLGNLTTLHLQNNNIMAVDKESFLNQRNLRNLDLSFNRLFALPQTMFDDVKKLTYLELSADSVVGIGTIADKLQYAHYWFRAIRNLREVILAVPTYHDVHNNFITDQRVGVRYMEEPNLHHVTHASRSKAEAIQESPDIRPMEEAPNSAQIRDSGHKNQ